MAINLDGIYLYCHISHIDHFIIHTYNKPVIIIKDRRLRMEYLAKTFVSIIKQTLKMNILYAEDGHPHTLYLLFYLTT